MTGMTAQQAQLYARIKAFRFDADGATFTFAHRLAGENGWPAAHARRVIEEYRRFAFLAAAAGHPVSPPDVVDQAWHLHLLYTRSYWDDFCPNVLRTTLHHEPGSGIPDQQDRFDDGYARTLDSYRRLFGEEPPSDLWPAPGRQAKKQKRFQRVDRNSHWVVPKMRKAWRAAGAATAVGLPAVALWGPLGRTGVGRAEIVAATSPFDLRGPEFLGFYFVVVAAAFLLAGFIRRAARGPGGPASGVKLDPYEVAYLSGGPAQAANVALIGLVARGMLRADRDGTVTAVGIRGALTHPLEQAAYDAVVSNPRDAVPVRGVRNRITPAARPIASRLKSAGLIVPNVRAIRSMALATLTALVAPAIGAVKISVGLSRHRPVEFLAVACAASTVGALLLFARRPHRTRAGDATLSALRAANGTLRHGRSRQTPVDLGMGVALFGIDVLAGTSLEPLYRTFQPADRGASGGGCSASSCGSGSSCGGGGGCGGGGCGGGGCGGCSS